MSITEFLICPDCGGDFDVEFICINCMRKYILHENYINLLPLDLSQNKVNEDLGFSDDILKGANLIGYPWRRIIGRLDIERFDREIVNKIPEGRFLEIAGASCWASAIYKSVHPDSFAIATDVSENAITKMAIPLGKMFTDQIDLYATVDAETLPFKDETLDGVFIQAAMHHMVDPVRMLREIRRVLKPGGKFIAVDHCVPKHFRFLFNKTARNREELFGIQEDLVSYGCWERYFSEANIPLDSLHIYTNPAYQRNPLFAIAGIFISRLPSGLAKLLFPVGLYVEYHKPILI